MNVYFVRKIRPNSSIYDIMKKEASVLHTKHNRLYLYI